MDTDTAVPSRRPVAGGRRHTATGRTALPFSIATSFLWPGVAQLRRGRPRAGIALATPQALLAAGAIAALVAGSGVAMGWLLNPTVLLAILVLDVVVLVTRLFAMGDAYVRVGRQRSAVGRATSALLLVTLTVVSVGIHGVAGQLTWGAYDTLTTVFSPSGPQGGAFSDQPTPSAVASPTPSETVVVATPTSTPTPQPTPSPTPRPDWLADGRLNLLLVGADAGPGRWKLRTDTMILLTVDASTGRAALIGIPRNLRFVPVPPPLDAAFPSGFTDLLNALWVYVDATPGSYPGDPAIAPFAALQDTVGLLTGLHVDAMAVAELQGFVRAVDALGGLDITVPAAVYDAQYPAPDGTGNVELYIPAGAQHLDGWHALAYARTRHQDSDYQRMERQQTVLVALQRQLRCNLVARLPDLLTIARDTLWTNLPLDELPGVVDLGRRVDPDRIVRLTLTPPTFAANLDPASVDAIRAAVANVLAGPEPTPDPSASAEPNDGCGPGG